MVSERTEVNDMKPRPSGLPSANCNSHVFKLLLPGDSSS